MISKQQRRLLFLFIVAFGLLTVPVILVLNKLVSENEANTVSTAVVQEKITVAIQAKNPVSPESKSVVDNSKVIPGQTDNHQANQITDSLNTATMQRAFIAGNWVVVDCARRLVLQCPHRLLNTGTSPRYGKMNNVFQSHCRDVSIKLDSFCKL